MPIARRLRRMAAAVEFFLAAALAVLYRFAYFRAGMNHHAKFRRMALLKDHLRPGGWAIWTVFAVGCAVAFWRMKRTPLWYRLIGIGGCIGLLILLHFPTAKTWILYAYLFYVLIGCLVLHLSAGWIGSRFEAKKQSPKE